MKSKILIAFFLIAVFVIGFYSYKLIKGRHFASEPETEKTEEINIESKTSDNLTEESSDNEIDSPIEVPIDADIPEEDQYDNPITGDEKVDECDSECEGLESEELEYCRQICGLAAVKKDGENCGDLEGLKKDYCFKDLAVAEKDYEICEKIKDSGIKKTCQNRITEDIFDEQIKSNEAL